MENLTPNQSTKNQIKNFLLSGKVLTSCTAAKEFLTADLRKYISMLRSEGLPISDRLIENNNKKRFKQYFININGSN